MKEVGRKVRFVGGCASACTLFLALPPDQTCLREGAYFRFHAPTASAAAAVKAYMMRKYPRWVRVWIAAQGGLSSRLATMSCAYDISPTYSQALVGALGIVHGIGWGRSERGCLQARPAAP